jgi:hypothetical protein
VGFAEKMTSFLYNGVCWNAIDTGARRVDSCPETAGRQEAK